MVDHVQDPTPHDNFRGDSATWVVWANMLLVKSHEFLYIFGFFLTRPRRISWPELDNLYAKTNVSRQACAFWGLNIWLHLRGGGQTPKNLPPNWREEVFSSINGAVEKSTYLENLSTDWHKIFCASSDHQRRNGRRAQTAQCGGPPCRMLHLCLGAQAMQHDRRQHSFMGGLVTLYYKSKMAADAMLDFR